MPWWQSHQFRAKGTAKIDKIEGSRLLWAILLSQQTHKQLIKEEEGSEEMDQSRHSYCKIMSVYVIESELCLEEDTLTFVQMDAQAQGRQECSKEKEESREECSKSRKTKKMKCLEESSQQRK
ncbi:hypothetical protein Tco_0030997 [Tanacetum coccineum]